MDSIQAIAASAAIIVVVLLMLMFVCHLFGPKASAWVCSNHEEKIGLSQNKIFNANGYLINSGSDILLSSTGSFRRFDSIDRDYKEIGQTSVTSPTWNIPIPEVYPPQPLRPAPAPSTKGRKSSLDRPVKQQSCDAFVPLNTIIPRPVAKRQMSSPAGTITPINLSDAVAKITNGHRSCTNPFLNGSAAIIEQDNSTETAASNQVEQSTPFWSETIFTVEKEKSLYECSTNVAQAFQVKKTTMDETKQTDGNEYLQSVFNFNTKCLDSSLSNAFENNFVSCAPTNFRNRSLSETEMLEPLDNTKSQIILAANSDSNPFRSNLQKTLSETYLEQYSMNQRNRSASQTWTFGRSLSRQGSNSSLTRSQFAIGKENSDANLIRAMSCESVSSESSVILEDLEQPTPAVTGMLCIGLQYDKNTLTDEGVELVVTVMEAKELVRPSNSENVDTFVRIYLVPDETGALQTKLFKNSLCPSYNETFCFWLKNTNKRARRSLWFHLYHSGSVHTLLGEAELKVGDVTRPITTWLSLSDSRHNNSVWGELMFSISYLPTAERLTVVVVKARNLKLNDDEQHNTLNNVFVKVYLLKSDRKVFKKKTSIKRTERSPIFNESMTFSVPPYMLNSIQVRLTVVNGAEINGDNNKIKIIPIGHVIVGGNTSGKGLRHWNQMLTSLRKPVAMWHALRQSVKRLTTLTDFTTGAFQRGWLPKNIKYPFVPLGEKITIPRLRDE